MTTQAINKKSVEKAEKVLPNKELLQFITEVFKALGDPTRTKILYALRKKTLCVRDISLLVGITESATSHQLSHLKGKRLVKAKREGTTMYYSISYNHLSALLKEAEFYADHIRSGSPDHPYDQA